MAAQRYEGRRESRTDRETKRLGPARVRVGVRSAPKGPRSYVEALGGTVRVGTINKPGTALNGEWRLVFTDAESGNIHLVLGIDPQDVQVITDWENFYGERIDAKRMTLAEYTA